MAQQAYPIPKQQVFVTEEIKKSRFITYLAHTKGLQQAKLFVQQTKAAHPDARHHCWACVSDSPQNSTAWGFSDDGEPSGTAGKPILAQLTGSKIGEITAVVVRYSGGIKLGTGGLVKAYGGGTKQALSQLQTEIKHITHTIHCLTDYDSEAQVRYCAEQYKATVIDCCYQQQVLLIIEVNMDQVHQFKQNLIHSTRGRVSFPDSAQAS